MGFNLYSGNYKLFLIVPIVLTFVLAYFAFISPGLQQGLDIKGGTLFIIQTENPVDQPELENALSTKFDLLDLKVTATSFGVRVQYADSIALSQAKELLSNANRQLDSNPVAAKQLAIDAVGKTTAFFSDVPDLSREDPAVAVSKAQDAIFAADESFNKAVQTETLSVLGINADDAKIQKRTIGAALGRTFWENAINVTIMGLIGIAIVIFIFFRELIPSIAIVYAAIFDILAALAFMAFLQIPLSLATIPALLMLIGYSIDTDILLTTRILRKKQGTDIERAMDSFGTGITMTLTALAAITVMMILAYFTGINLIFEIGGVLVGGLIGDIIVTWLANGPIVLWYAEHKRKGKVAI